MILMDGVHLLGGGGGESQIYAQGGHFCRRGTENCALGCLELQQQISWSLALQNAEQLKLILSSNQ